MNAEPLPGLDDDTDIAVHGAGQPPRDGKSQSGATALAANGGVGLLELVEQPLLVFLR